MIRVWDVEQGTCLHQLTGHLSLTSGMQLRGNILVSGNADSTVRIWNIESGKCLHTLAGRKPTDLLMGITEGFFPGKHKHASAVTWVQVVLNYVVSSGDDGTVKLWDLETGDFIRDLVSLESAGNGGKTEEEENKISFVPLLRCGVAYQMYRFSLSMRSWKSQQHRRYQSDPAGFRSDHDLFIVSECPILFNSSCVCVF